MTPEEIWKWQEEMFIYGCFLYQNNYETVLNDENHDALAHMLHRHYNDCSPEFKARVTRDQLTNGSAIGLHFSEDEEWEAKAWFFRIRGVDPICLSDL